ncbi:MAG: extracellular solute-binding protein [Butyrivibrio sp.]|nr:extracellular solute-binding protein [Butyrivibrio sp.]
MNKRKIITLLMAGTFILTACSDKEAESETTSTETTTIRIINSKSEVETQMKALADAFNKSQSEIIAEIETIPSGVDIQSTIKGYYLADTMPDIITCESSGFEKWEGLLADLSDMSWTKDTDAAFVDSTYGTLGFPYTTEAIGLAYNADILNAAGIDPDTLTSPSAYETAFATLEEKKDSLGLTAVVGYCAEKDELYWSSGNHLFGAYLDEGLNRNDTTYIDMLKEGSLDDNRIKAYADFIGLLNKYSDPALLTKGTYDDQVLGFASGKYAFVTQGSWIGTILTGADSEAYEKAGSFEVGMAPYAFEDGIETILTNSPSWWAVVKEGNVDASKVFLEFCYSDAGQKILVEEAGFVSPFKSCSYIASDPFAAIISEYLSNSKTSSWHWMDMKEGFAQNYIAPCFYDYADGKYDADGFVTALKKAASEVYTSN